MTQPERTHDKALYLAENRYGKAKELHKAVASVLVERGLVREGSVVLDVGCAAGEFLYHLARRLPGVRLLGFDLVPELVDKARAMVPEAVFHQGSLLDADACATDSADAVVAIGVHTLFDDPAPMLDNMLGWVLPGGSVVLAGTFNPDPVDVWLQCRRAHGPDDGHRETGWNVWSRLTMERLVTERLGPGRCDFTPFELPMDLPRHEDDPLRTWTVRLDDGSRLLVNGLTSVRYMDIMVVRV